MSGFDMTESIAPKSDQLNAEDLLSGPRTFTIAEVRKGTPEQPVDVHLVEFPGRPFKPSKTVRRIMVSAWGPDASTYVGKRLTLYRDATVRFGGQDVGGIRVSHMSDLKKPMTIALTVTRGKRAPHTVQPLTEAPTPPRAEPVTDQQLKDVDAGLTRLGITDREAKLAMVAQTIARDIKSARDLTKTEATRVLEYIRAEETASQEQLPEVTK